MNKQELIDNIAESADISKADRKSTRLNSSHGYISYAVFCLKKKNTHSQMYQHQPARWAEVQLAKTLIKIAATAVGRIVNHTD